MTVYTQSYVRSISEKVYRAELARAAGGNDPAWKAGEADRMIAKYNEKGEDGQAKFSRNAGQYDHLTRAYLDTLLSEVPLTEAEQAAATDGTIVWGNDYPLAGQPIGLEEIRRRKTLLFFDGIRP